MNDRALKVLEQYDLEVISTRRGRGSYILETPQGLRILSDYTGSEKKALFQNHVMEKIREGGYERVDLLLPNKEEGLVSRDWEGNKYVVKEWYAGRECDTGNEGEILTAVSNLARLHRLMYVTDDENGEFSRNFTAPYPEKEIRAQNVEMKKVRSFIRKKNDKGEFERLFLQCFETYFEQAQEAEVRLGQIPGLSAGAERDYMKMPGMPVGAEGDYMKMPGMPVGAEGNQVQMSGKYNGMEDGHVEAAGWSSDQSERKIHAAEVSETKYADAADRSASQWNAAERFSVCHGDYDHHHILLAGYDTATTNFECCRFDYQVSDLYRFMRKILEKHEWSPRLGMRMLEHYAMIRPLPREEKKLLYIKMLYPEKFRKLANYYYGSNKAWVSRRYLDKLEKLNRQEETKRIFVRMLERQM